VGAAPWAEPPLPTAQRRVRWGIGDILIVWFVGLFGAVVAGAFLVGARGTHDTDALDIAVTVPAQYLPMLGAAALVARTKGVGSLRADFGLAVHLRDWPWLLLGVGMQIASSILLLPISELSGTSQEIVQTLERSGGPALVAAALGVAILAPIAEELVFRGMLLRALARRTGLPVAVALSAAIFGVAHLVDPNAAPVLAPLVALGLLSGVRAVRTGDLSQSILLHAGFNLFTAILLLTG
jgi:membrane protease YdiL (CAAX protease family)